MSGSLIAANFPQRVAVKTCAHSGVIGDGQQIPGGIVGKCRADVPLIGVLDDLYDAVQVVLDGRLGGAVRVGRRCSQTAVGMGRCDGPVCAIRPLDRYGPAPKVIRCLFPREAAAQGAARALLAVVAAQRVVERFRVNRPAVFPIGHGLNPAPEPIEIIVGNDGWSGPGLNAAFTYVGKVSSL